METSLPTPTTASVYVNLPEGKSIHSFFRVSVDGIRFRVKNGTVAWNFCALGRSRRTRKKVNMQQKEKRKRVTQRFKIWWNYMKLYGTKIWQLYTVMPFVSFCMILSNFRSISRERQLRFPSRTLWSFWPPTAEPRSPGISCWAGAMNCYKDAATFDFGKID